MLVGISSPLKISLNGEYCKTAASILPSVPKKSKRGFSIAASYTIGNYSVYCIRDFVPIDVQKRPLSGGRWRVYAVRDWENNMIFYNW